MLLEFSFGQVVIICKILNLEKIWDILFLFIPVDPLSVVARPSAACVSFLSEDLKYHQPVTSLSWNPQGSLLLSSSAADNTMYVWNTASELKVPVKRISGGGIHLAKWSPVGSAVMSATTSTVFRIWNTSNWLPERWNVLSGHINRYYLSVLNQLIEFWLIY